MNSIERKVDSSTEIFFSSKRLVYSPTPPTPLQLQPPPPSHFSYFLKMSNYLNINRSLNFISWHTFDLFVNEPDNALLVIVNNPNPKHINDS